MAKEIIQKAQSLFEQVKQTDENGNEFWMVRQLSKALDYADFRNFTTVIEKAIEASKNNGNARQLECQVETCKVINYTEFGTIKKKYYVN